MPQPRHDYGRYPYDNQTKPLDINSIAFVVNGEFCLLAQNATVARIFIERESQFRVSTTTIGCWSSQLPLIVDGLALIANAQNGQILKFNLATFTFI